MKELADYENLPVEELLDRIARVRREAGDRLEIYAHYYICDEVVRLADFVGDSLALARRAAESRAEAILFCGVHFMLETADILANRPEKLAARNGARTIVMAAEKSAGCPMADMITAEQAQRWKEQIAELVDFNEFTPISYVNSSATTKAFCGANGGAICTSSNAEQVLRDALARRPRALFMPDSRLGRTTALALGVRPDEIALWDPRVKAPYGGLTPDAIRNARVILWDGFCPTHQRFSAQFIRDLRSAEPNAQVWVHPESQRAIVELSDGYGSTSKLIDVVKNAPSGATLAIGTEWKLVSRLQNSYPDKKILWPGDEPLICVQMAKTTLWKVAWTLENWIAGEPVNVVSTPSEIADLAFEALKSLLK
ncbi:MAG: quinolinate synthase NadA [Thermoguttaceae bacterium]|nr:quinolinate synthase NadA [Thermoguttaceae bacterium]